MHYLPTGNYKAAVVKYRKIHDDRERLFGLRHPKIASILGNILHNSNPLKANSLKTHPGIHPGCPLPNIPSLISLATCTSPPSIQVHWQRLKCIAATTKRPSSSLILPKKSTVLSHPQPLQYDHII